MKETLSRLRLLLWKNWLMQKRRRKRLLLDVFIPFFVGAFLLYIRSLTDTFSTETDTVFKPFSPIHIPPLSMFPTFKSIDFGKFILERNQTNEEDTSPRRMPSDGHGAVSAYLTDPFEGNVTRMRWHLAWSPSHDALNSIMTRACRKLDVIPLRLKDAKTLEETMTRSSRLFPKPKNMILAGVVFPDKIANVDEVLHSNINIRFPAEMRIRDSSVKSLIAGLNWLTSLIYPIFQSRGPREGSKNEGASPDYWGEGFLGVQTAVSSAILEHSLDGRINIELPDIKLQRFPYPEFLIDPLLIALQNFLPFLIMMSFLFPVSTIVEKMTTEKEKRLKIVMNIMGLSNSLRWSSWYIYSLIFFSFLITILVIVFKVPFVNGQPLLPNSDWSCLVVFLLCYASAAITFSFVINTIFTKASASWIVSGIAWFLIFSPFYVVQTKYAELDTLTKTVSSLLVNTGMGIGLQVILMHEGEGWGIQWDRLTTPANPDDGMTFGLVLLLLLFDCLLYLGIALYIENVFPGEFGTPLPWYYPFQRSYWFGNRNDESEGVNDNSNDASYYPLEDGPRDLNAGIEIKNLRKVYGKNGKVAVKNLSLKAYEGQITVLMGFNGAGKTTTFSILTGIYPPTSGTATVAGFDVRTNMKDVRRSMGFCPQYNVLFDELTVEEHILFYGRLKGADMSQVRKDIDKYINVLNLSDKRHTMAKQLSGGMKRKLSVALAMCGDSKVLLFDEPTAGMDIKARRSLWDLLIAEKKGRSILITTHYVDEADLLGDRVAIMSEGELNCNGSTFFLKKHFSCGYRLVIVKKDKCITRKVTELIERHIPEDLNCQDIGMELSYQLPEKYSNKFEKLFDAIEREKDALEITSFGVSPTSLEDVFASIAAKVDSDKYSCQTRTEQDRRSNDIKVNIMNDNRVRGSSLAVNQTLAMLYKHSKSTLRLWQTYILLVLIAICGVSVGVFTIKINGQLIHLPPRHLGLQNFPDGIVAAEAGRGCTGECLKLFESYKSVIDQQKVEFVKLDEDDYMSKFLIDESKKDINMFHKYILGTTFDMISSGKISITGWFNSRPYHVPPIALSNIYNSLLQALVRKNASLSFTNEPLPYEEDTKISLQNSGLDAGFQIALFIGFSFIFISSSFITFPVQERESKAKLMQFVSGINCFIFWFVALFWNLFVSLGPNAAAVATLAFFEEDGYKEADEIGSCALVIVSFFLTLLPLIYLASLFLRKPALAFILLMSFNVITGIYSTVLVMVLQMPMLEKEDVAKVLDWVFSVFPVYSMTHSFQSVNVVSLRMKMCKSIYDNYCVPNKGFINVCCRVPEQCPNGKCLDWTESVWDLNPPGFGKYMSFSYGSAALFFIMLLVLDSGLLNFLKRRRGSTTKLVSNNDRDTDVLSEREKIKNISDERKASYSLLINGLSKSFGNNVAVNDLYLTVKEGECFGLLGANGAGKTTTFAMLTGDEFPTSGDAFVKGCSITSDTKNAHKLIGYCPQFDALFDDLTGREHLKMYCLIRGIPLSDVHDTSVELARELLFEEFLDKKVKEYSGGNKRKLSTALSLIGNPPVVYLDEPTAGIDPVAKRHLWSTISKIRTRGTTIILTSHSMEECEALCTKLTIMVKGEFKCLGTSQYLKNKFCQGYSLTIKVKKGRRETSEVNDNESNDKCIQHRVRQIKNFVTQNFPGATLAEEHQELLVYKLPYTNLTWSKMFGLVETHKEKLNIEDYTLGQTTLEQIFLKIIASSGDTDETS